MAENEQPEQDLTTRTRAAVAAAIAASGQGDQAIGSAIGRRRQSARNYMNGDHTIPLDIAVALAAHLQLTVDQLAGAAPLPDQSPQLLAVAKDLRSWADAQEDLAKLLRDAAQTVESHAGQARGEAGTG